jgi:O-antigen/teichoic acid export membrane protein
MEKKSIFRNYIFDAIYSMLNILIPLITAPYISRILEANGVGKVSYAQNIVTYFILLAALGIPNYGVREIARNRGNRSKESKTFIEIFTINLISTCITSSLYYLCILKLEYFAPNRLLYCIVGITLLLNVFNIDWFYKGIEEFKYITIRGSIIKIISVACIFIFVKDKADLYIYALIITLSTSINYIINVIHVRKYIIKSKEKLQLTRHLKMVVVLLATIIAVELYTLLDTTMVGYICGDKYVGYYSSAMKISKIIAVAISSLGTVLLPRLSMYYSENKVDDISKLASKAVEYVLFISIPCAVGITLVSEDFVFVMFGETFEPAGLTMKILVWLVPILCIGNIFGTQLLIAIGQERKLMYTVFLGATINIVMNAFLIPNYQQNGASIASVVAELAVMSAQIFMTKKYVRIIVSKKNCLNLFIQTLFMAVVVYFVVAMQINSILRFVLAISMGVTSYFGLGFVLKNELEFEAIKRIIRRR